MKLKRLIVQGFKSFKDRTVINFDDGITGIVGPNGCGKSNIVDALFWVMGEQSAKHLRGSTMKDVIFSGSSRYSPAAFAEATLVLENSEGKHIHIGNKVSSPSEIQLTRKLYRNGESEYRINGSPARLKDIQEVFMDTGAGAKSYSIIAQGEINRLVQAKPEERRTMIEEVAGVTKFKLRKRESLRKIEQTEQNLSRLQDLKLEIEKNLKALQKQAEKAERARSLKDKIRRNDLVVQSHKVFELLKSFRDGRQLVNERQLELQTWATQKESLEVGLHEERLLKDEMSEKIEKSQSEFNQMSKELAALEERFNHLCSSLTEKETEIERRESELEQISEEMSERSLKKDELVRSLEELENESSENNDFSELESRVGGLKNELETTESELSKLKKLAQEKRQQLQDLEQDIFRNTSKLDDYASSLEDMAEEIESLEKQYSGVSGELAQEREQIRELEKIVNEMGETEKELTEKLTQQNETYKSLNKKATEKSRELIHKESTVSSLREVNEGMEGAKEGAAEFLKSDKGEGFDLLGRVIKCAPEYTQAVQGLLAPHIDSIIGLSADQSALWEWQSQNEHPFDYLMEKKGTTFSAEVKDRLALKGLTNIYPLTELVEWPQELSERFEGLLAGLFVVDELTPELVEKLNDGIGFYGVASRDGSFVLRNSLGALTYSRSSENESQGIVARNNKIKQLEEEMISLKEEVNTLESEVVELESGLEKSQSELEVLREDFSNKKAELAAKKSALVSRVSNLATGSERLEILKKRHSEISKSRLELLESEESFSAKKIELQEAVDELTQKQAGLEENCESLRSKYQAQREELVQLEVNAKSYQQRWESARSQVDDIERQLERLKQRETSQKELIEKSRDEIEQVNVETQELETKNQQVANELSEREKVLSEKKEELSKILVAMQEREDEVKDLTSKINRAEKESVEVQAKIERVIGEEEELTRNVFEKYRIDLRQALATYLEMEADDLTALAELDDMYVMETENGQTQISAESYEFSRRYGQDLKDCEVKLRSYKQEYNRLGEINWQAIEDYERQKLRFDFLQTQELELKQSLEDLRLAIEHIDEKSRERFRVAFDEVNQRFEKVFPIIFGGGSAQLRVVGDINDPDCGVDIIAQPPGKKMQNINLMSGGEKALTAVSLIFSIFLVKPSPFCLLDEVDAPLDDANVGRFNELLREMSHDSQFILITHNKKTMELNDMLYGVTMQEAGVSKAVSVQLH